ncbi:hypothetical protein Leryth_006242 [Lithospermum erythrorhizon]|nr:hypothetical protein Leryth_006242 [Lithospermum erythrorhizon]
MRNRRTYSTLSNKTTSHDYQLLNNLLLQFVGVDLIFDDLGFNVPHNLKILSRGGMLIITSFCDVRNVRLDLGLLEKKQIKLSGILSLFYYMLTERERLLKKQKAPMFGQASRVES